MLAHVVAFVLGMYEFRRSFTTSYDDDSLCEAYGWGREIAHRMTLRYFDHA